MLRNLKPNIKKEVHNKHGHFNRNFIDCNINNFIIKFNDPKQMDLFKEYQYFQKHNMKTIKNSQNNNIEDVISENRQRSILNIQNQLHNSKIDDYESDKELEKFYQCEEELDENEHKNDRLEIYDKVRKYNENLKKDQFIEADNLILEDWDRL